MRRIFCLFALAALLLAQQPKSEDELKADLTRAIQERNGTHVLVALLDLNQFYQRHRLWAKQAEVLKLIISYWSSHIGNDSIGVGRYSADLAEALERAGDTANAEKEAHIASGIFDKSGPEYRAANIRTKRILCTILRKESKQEEAALEATLPPQQSFPHRDKYPQVLSKRDPEYTNAAREKHVSGDITLSFTVDETGKAKDIEIMAPLGFGLDENAIKAIKKWKFSPGISNSAAVSTYVEVHVSFRLLQ